MNTSRTKILEQWCCDIEAIVEKHLSLVYTEKFDDVFLIDVPDSDEKIEINVFPDLSVSEMIICKEILESKYCDLLNNLRVQKPHWQSMVHALSIIYENVDHYNFSIHHTVEIKVDHLIDDLKSSLGERKSGLLYDLDDSCVDDFICLSNDEIISRGKSITQKKSLLERIKFLQLLRKKFIEYKGRHDILDYLKFKRRLSIAERNSRELERWIEDAILNATPSIEFLSRTQIEMLRKEIKMIGWTTNNPFPPEFLNDRFEQLILTRSTCVGQPDFRPFQSIEEIKMNSQPAVIIRYLIYGIRGFNQRYRDGNDLKDLKIWISTLFDDVQGYSYDSIRKALERNKGKYKVPTRP